MERKLKTCVECGKPSILWRSHPKLCKSCAGKPKYQKVKKEKLEVKQGLNVFFANQALQFPSHCENCGLPLMPKNMWDRRKMTCHILPKSPTNGFPTVAIHPQNRIFMCCDSGGYCHDKWDNGDAQDRIKMPVYNLAIERFESFKSLLTPKELIKAIKYLQYPIEL